MNPISPSQISQVKLVCFDFDGVFTDNRVLVSETGEESVFCYRGDGIGLELLRKMGLKLLVLSTEVNPVVARRCEKLNIPCLHGVEDKLQTLKNYIKACKCELSEVAFLGNDINDLACLKEVGLPAVVGDAHPDTKEVAMVVTEKFGGYGAVREFCEMIEEKMKVQV